MDEIQIRVKVRKEKAEKSRLPSRVPSGYPAKRFVVFITSEAWRTLSEYCLSDLNCELGGVLVGRVGKSSRRSFVEIQNFIPAEKGVSRRASFEFTNQAQEAIHEVMLSKFRDRRIVGWFHTHPGYGIFLSSADQFIDEHYFNQNYHIAVVIDPTRQEVEAGAFVWDKNKMRVRVPMIEVD